MAGGLLGTIVVLQFAGVIPWAGDEASYIGGDWTGVLVYGFVAGMMFAAGYAWLTVKPWASMITILAALVGFFIPFVSHMDGTDPRSSAIAPLVVSVLMLFMVFRPSTNRAMGMALSGQGSVKTPKAPPPPKPMSAARKRELAAEQQKKASTVPAVASPAVVTSPAAPVAAKPAAAVSPAVPLNGKSAAAMVMSAASAVKAAAATPASPRKSVAPPARPAAPQKPAVAPTAAPTSAQDVRALRADEV